MLGPVVVGRRAETAARIVAFAFGAWFVLAAAWGLFGAIGAGHYGTLTSFGIVAENMIRWKTIGPVWSYTSTAPSPSDWYCHHPFGTFWTTWAFVRVFGHQDWLLPLPAVLMSAATVWLVWDFSRRAFGAIPAAAGVAGFSVIPLCLAFANFHALEVSVMFGAMLCFWGQSRMIATGRKRYLAASLFGLYWATATDWPAWMILAVTLGWGLLRAFVLPRRATPPVGARYAQWWALSASLAVAMLVLWVGLFQHAGKLGDWLQSAQTRGGGGQTTLDAALAARKFWIEISFLPPTIFVGKVAAVVAALRFAVRRVDDELHSLALLFGATVQYVVFKGGADVHIFWPQYFGAFYALGVAQLVATLMSAAAFAARTSRAPGFGRRLAAVVGLAAGLALPVASFPDALRTLRYARETGARFNERGNFVDSDVDAVLALRELAKIVPPGAGVEAHTSMRWSWHHEWAVRAPATTTGAMPGGRSDGARPFFVARASGLSPEQQRQLANGFHVRAYGDVWVVDRREPPAPIDVLRFDEREPSIVEWYLFSGVEPVRTIAADPYGTWEWRTALGQPATPPDVAPVGLESLRIAHNVAISLGDRARAADLRARIERELSKGAATDFGGTIRLVGTRVAGRAQPRLETWFEATSAPGHDLVFSVRAQVEAKKRMSLVPVDTIERDVADAMPMSPKLWREGGLYVHTSVLRQRIGVERFFGSWSARDGSSPPRRVDGASRTDLVTLR